MHHGAQIVPRIRHARVQLQRGFKAVLCLVEHQHALHLPRPFVLHVGSVCVQLAIHADCGQVTPTRHQHVRQLQRGWTVRVKRWGRGGRWPHHRAGAGRNGRRHGFSRCHLLRRHSLRSEGQNRGRNQSGDQNDTTENTGAEEHGPSLQQKQRWRTAWKHIAPARGVSASAHKVGDARQNGGQSAAGGQRSAAWLRYHRRWAENIVRTPMRDRTRATERLFLQGSGTHGVDDKAGEPGRAGSNTGGFAGGELGRERRL